MLVVVLDGTDYKTYERGSLGNIPQNKKNVTYFEQLVHSQVSGITLPVTRNRS